MGLLSSLKSVDLIGPSISLSVDGGDRVKSSFGAVLTLVYFLALLAATGVFLASFFDDRSPAISYETDFENQGLEFRVGEEGLLPFAVLLSKKTTQPVDAVFALRLVSIQLIVSYFEAESATRKKKSFSAVPCSEVFQNPTLYNYMAKSSNYQQLKMTGTVGSSRICFSIPKSEVSSVNHTAISSELSAQVNEEDSQATTLSVAVYPCLQSVKSNCLPAKEILDYATSFVFPKNNFVESSLDSPVSLKFDSRNPIVVGDYSSIRIDNLDMTRHEIQDMRRFAMKAKSAASFTKTEVIQGLSIERAKDSAGNLVFGSTATPLNSALYMLRFQTNTEVVTISRTYPQVSDLIGLIGGAATMMITFFTYVNSFYMHFCRKLIVVKQLFPFFPVSSNPFNLLLNIDSSESPRHRPRDASSALNSKEGSKQRKQRWKEVVDDASEMIDSSIDMFELFGELSQIKLIAEILFDEYQKELITISSLQLFRDKLRAEKEEKRNKKSLPSSKKGSKQVLNDLISKQREALRVISRRAKSAAGEQTQLSLATKIDLKLLDCVNKLAIDYLEPIEPLVCGNQSDAEEKTATKLEDKSTEGGRADLQVLRIEAIEIRSKLPRDFGVLATAKLVDSYREPLNLLPKDNNQEVSSNRFSRRGQPMHQSLMPAKPSEYQFDPDL